jgi:predicted MFS family arabinose efflux permease
MSNQSIISTSEKPTFTLFLKISVITLCRLVLNTSRRFAYPFAPVLSRGMGVPLTAVTSLIAANQITGILGIFFGPLADRLGYRLMMLAGLGIVVVAMFAAGLLPFYGVVLTALFAAGIGKITFDPAIQAYVGERVPFHRRGMVVGVLEMSWAGTTLLGIPFIALLIDQFGWRAPFFALSGFGLLGILGLIIFIPKDIKHTSTTLTSIGFKQAWQNLIKERAAVGALGFSFFLSAANDNLFVVYGAWLEKDFNLSILALGLGTSIIGVAELLGEGMTATLADKFGLKRSLVVGILLTAISYGVLPFLGQTLPMALTGIFIIFLIFEYTIVTALSLCTELLPGSRATMMAGFLAAGGLGRVFGTMIGGPVWLSGGILFTGLVSAAISGLALVSSIWGLWGWEQQ